MPAFRHRRKRRSRKRRPRRRRRKAFNNVMTIRRSPMALKFKATLLYTDEINLDPGVAGVAAYHSFRANDCFDPDETGVGHQPRGFDQIIPMYEHFTVIGSKMKATFMATVIN